MKNLKIIIPTCLFSVFLYTNRAEAQGITIASGASITIVGSPSIEIKNGDFINNGTYSKETETMIFSGNTAKTISGSSNTEINNLVINNTGGITTQLTMLDNKNLTVELGSKFTVAANKYITVSDNLTNNAGSAGLVLKSDVNGTASLIHFTPNIKATVERFVTGNAWHLMFAPLSEIPTTVYTTEGTSKNYNLYSYNESQPDYWNAASTYGTSGWAAEYSHVNLPTTKGYIFNRYGLPDKTFTQAGGVLFVGQKDFTVSYTKNESAIGNEVSQTWEYFDGWNIIGNPYASAIDWDLLINDDIEAGVYFYYDDNYRYYVYGDKASKWNVGLTLNGGSNYIPAGQAFFVKVKNTGVTHSAKVSIVEEARLHHPKSFYKSTSEVVPNILRLKISQGNFTDETIIRTVPDATDGHDGNYDANKMFSWNKTRPQIYSQNALKDENFAIDALPEIQSDKAVPLGIYTGVSGQYTISFTENSFEGYRIWLEDKLLDTIQNISANKNYEFIQGVENNTNRFILHFNINHAPLSVSIPNQSMHVNTDFNFVIPANTFADIDSADILKLSAGLSDGTQLPEWLAFDASTGRFYGSPDKKQTIEVTVNAIDFFGLEAKSTFTIEVLERALYIDNQETYEISVYPNPSTGNFNIKTGNLSNSKMTISDIMGRTILQKQLSLPIETIEFGNAAKGIYFIEIQSSKGVFRKKIEIQ